MGELPWRHGTEVELGWGRRATGPAGRARQGCRGGSLGGRGHANAT